MNCGSREKVFIFIHFIYENICTFRFCFLFQKAGSEKGVKGEQCGNDGVFYTRVIEKKQFLMKIYHFSVRTYSTCLTFSFFIMRKLIFTHTLNCPPLFSFNFPSSALEGLYKWFLWRKRIYDLIRFL